MVSVVTALVVWRILAVFWFAAFGPNGLIESDCNCFKGPTTPEEAFVMRAMPLELVGYLLATNLLLVRRRDALVALCQLVMSMFALSSVDAAMASSPLSTHEMWLEAERLCWMSAFLALVRLAAAPDEARDEGVSKAWLVRSEPPGAVPLARIHRVRRLPPLPTLGPSLRGWVCVGTAVVVVGLGWLVG
mgnify:CR=1 FL=1